MQYRDSGMRGSVLLHCIPIKWGGNISYVAHTKILVVRGSVLLHCILIKWDGNIGVTAGSNEA